MRVRALGSYICQIGTQNAAWRFTRQVCFLRILIEGERFSAAHVRAGKGLATGPPRTPRGSSHRWTRISTDGGMKCKAATGGRGPAEVDHESPDDDSCDRIHRRRQRPRTARATSARKSARKVGQQVGSKVDQILERDRCAAGNYPASGPPPPPDGNSHES